MVRNTTAVKCLAVSALLALATTALAQPRTFSLSSIRNLCPRHVGGDREFGGHGPDVRASARLQISGDRRHLMAVTSLDAKETQRDFTHARQTFRPRRVLTAPNGFTFRRILSSTSSSTAYRDRNHAIDRPPVQGGLVRQFEIMGDTGGNDVGNCTNDDVFMNVHFNRVRVDLQRVPTPPQTRVFTPRPIRNLCPRHVGGDREFGGHGPDVRASARLLISTDRRGVDAVMSLNATETQRDFTRANGSFRRRVFTAPNGFTVRQILSNTSSSAAYRDRNHAIDRPPVQGGGLVRQFEIMGDTGGNDVGNCTNDDVFMNVHFNQVRVLID